MSDPIYRETQSVIYKHKISLSESLVLEIPKECDACFVGQQRGEVMLWVRYPQIVDDLVKLEFRIFGTGHTIPEGYLYIGTTQVEELVWHVMMRYL